MDDAFESLKKKVGLSTVIYLTVKFLGDKLKLLGPLTTEQEFLLEVGLTTLQENMTEEDKLFLKNMDINALVEALRLQKQKEQN